MHADVGLIKTMITNVQAAIAYVKRSAEQPKTDALLNIAFFP
jgi:hypothetical protein